MSKVVVIKSGGSKNLFQADAILSANRTHDLNGNTFAINDGATLGLHLVGNNLGMGITSPQDRIHILGAFRADRYVDNANGALFIGRKARGTETSPTNVLNGDILAQFIGRGWVDGDFNTASKVGINLMTDENWTSTAQGTAIRFATTLNGTTTTGIRMIIKNDGKVGIGTTTPSSLLEVQAINGNSGERILGLRNHTNTGWLAEFRNDGQVIASKGVFEGTFVGEATGLGVGSTMFGYACGISSATSRAVMYGNRAGVNNSGLLPTLIGYTCGQSNLGNNLTAIGYESALSNSGDDCVFFGYFSGHGNSGHRCVGVGELTLYQNQGNENTSVGLRAGIFTTGMTSNTNSSNSVFLGAFSRAGGANRVNQIVIGHEATGEGSNTARIGNSSVTELHVGGNGAALALKSPDGTTWRISVDNTGTLVIV